MAEKILIVDDEREITDLVALYLENERFTVFKCYTAQEALGCIAAEDLDLAILDVMLPDMSGFELCKRIRQEFHYPVIMLTAKIAEVDRITGLTLGADDYVTKPFLPLELVARVKAHQAAEIIQDTQVFVDDIFLSGSGVVRRKDVQLLRRLCYLEHELKESDGRLAGRCRALQELHRRVASQERLILI